MEYKDLIKNRYSCKSFNGKQVEEDKLTNILNAGRLAPTAKNLQEQHIYVVQSPENLEIIDSVTKCRYNAPTVLVVTYDKDNVFTYPGGTVDSGAEDISIIATQMMLGAYDEGVDSCWINLFDPQELKEKLNLPENEEIVMLLDLGYASEEGKPLPRHFERKDLSETVTYL